MNAFTRFLRLAPSLPPAAWQPAARALSAVVATRPPRPVRQWQLNVEVVTGQRPTRRATAAAVESWARNVMTSAQLGDWSRERVLREVHVDPADRERLLAAHREHGAVIALPHMGSWDLAGAWACAEGLAVSTVAEQGIAEFEHFVALRERIGFRVYGHRDPRCVAHLLADARGGRMVCLVTDRNFGRGGIPVSWRCADGPRTVRMPSGAVTVARRSGATLFGCACHFEPDGMRLVFSDPITPHGAATTSAVQQLADFFSEQVRANPVDWHVLVPFFDGVVAG